MAQTIKALLLGDIIGQSGCRALFIHLQTLVREYNADFILANGENAADGFGIVPELANRIFSSGVHIITSGNHIWQKDEILPMLNEDERLLRPANYPQGVAGKGTAVVKIKDRPIGIINLQGRVRLSDIDCPFRTAQKLAKKLKKATPIVIIDFHAESPEEKEALAYFLDGDVSMIAGTHTHVLTADARILPKGTGFITDLGMIGSKDSVIGFKKEIAIERSLTQLPLKMEVEENPSVINGVVVEISTEDGKAISIQTIQMQSEY